MERALYSVSEFLDEVVGISRSKFYAEVRAGRLRIVKVGSRTFVPRASVAEYIETLEVASTNEE